MNFKRITYTLGLLGLLYSSDSLASKIDTIYFQGGDRVTGEVKLLENNYLKLSTNDAGTLKLEWNKIDSVKIMNPMRVVFKNGEIYFGKLLPSGEDKGCMIWGTTGIPKMTMLTEIVYMTPFNDKFVNRLSGSLSSGFSYTKANKVMQLNVDGSITYLAKKNQLVLSYDGIVTSQDSVETTQRQSGGVSFQRLLNKNWFLISKLNMESNSELDLDLRTSLSAGGGNSVVNTNRSFLYFAAGLQGTREVSAGDLQFNIEGWLSTAYSVFVYDSPKVSFDISGDVIPSLNDLGRIRYNVNSSLSWEIFSDFYLKWSFYYSYDSRPPSDDASKSDWAVSMLGLEYKL